MIYQQRLVIETIEENSDTLELIHSSKIIGNTLTDNNFQVEDVCYRVMNITPAKAITVVPIDILNLLDISIEEIASIFIEIKDVNILTVNNNLVSFELEIGQPDQSSSSSTVILPTTLTANQFIINNISGLNSSFIITAINCPIDTTCILKIIVTRI